MSELQRLEHRLVVLLLVANDELDDDPVADALLGDHLERPGPDLGQILACLAGAEEGQRAPAGPRGLEGVVDVGQLLVQQGPAAQPVHDPQILEGRDVAEVPDQRAHQRGMDALQVGVRDTGHQGLCALP